MASRESRQRQSVGADSQPLRGSSQPGFRDASSQAPIKHLNGCKAVAFARLRAGRKLVR